MAANQNLVEQITLSVESTKDVQFSADEAQIINAVSPKVNIRRMEDGAVITVTDVDGVHDPVTVYDGAKGEKGDAGGVQYDSAQTLNATQKQTARTNISAASEEDVTDLKSAISDISYEKSNYKNYFDFSSDSLIYYTSDLSASFEKPNVLLSFTQTANPVANFKIPNLFPSKTYRLKFAITNGTLNESFCYIRKYKETNPHDAQSLKALTFTDHVCNTEFTVPSGEYAVTLELQLRYNSKAVTLSNVSVEPKDVEIKRVVKESAENTNVVQMSFIYSTVTGDCTIMKIQGDVSDKVMMIDTMADNNAVAKTNITAALNNYEITHIDYLMISHYHSDHIGNIQWLVDNGYIDGDTVFILPEDVDDTSAGLIRDDNPDKVVVQHCADVLAIITTLDAEKVYPDENEVISINGCDFVFWNTDHSEYYALDWVDYNECSLCCTMIYGETVVQFTGDIGTRGCGKYYDKLYKCTIFKANHHACGYAVVPRFMSAVFPEIVVTMAGSSVIYSTDPAIQAVFATLSTGLQAWCETEFVPNFVTGVIKDNIYLTVDKGSFRFDSAARRCVRADEGIPVSS